MTYLPPGFFVGSSPIILVAGGAGFIGSHLCQRLLEKSVRVICLDNWSTGVRENITGLLENPNFHFWEHDITKPLPDLPRTEYVVHLAGVEAYLNGEDVSIETLEANSLGTKNLLDFSKGKEARFLLVSTINVFSAKISPTKLAAYFGGGRAQEGEFSHHEAKRFAEALTSEYLGKYNLDARVVRIADAFGPRMMLTSGNLLARLIKQAVYGGPLKVPGGEEEILFPIFIDDVVEGIEKALFSSGTREKIIALAGPRTSAFAAATAVKNVVAKNPKLSQQIPGDLVIEFSGEEFPKKETTVEILSSGQEVISWKPRTLFEEGLAKTLLWFLEHKTRMPKEKEEKEKVLPSGFWANFKFKPQFAKKITWVTVAFLLLLFLLLPFWLPFLEIGAGVLGLTLAKNALETAKVNQASFWAKGAGVFLGEARAGFGFWGNLPGLGKESRDLSTKSNSLVRVAQMAQNLARVGQETRVLLGGVFGEEPFDPTDSARKLSLELGVLERELGFLEAELDSRDVVVDFPIFPAFRASQNFDFAAARRAIGGLAGVMPQAAELLGQNGKKTYLVLFQNNMELRPTGGFIGSFALVTFDGGRFINLEVQDVYSADGQLRGHVEPPKPIKEHLSEASWFLRDSNWSPDFPTSARRAVWFIDKELGERVAGVLGIDLEVARELTRTYGPLDLPDFGETVTADNLYEKTQFVAEGDFFPGSRAKKDFLTALGRSLFEKILAKDKKGKPLVEKLLPTAKILFLAFEGRHAAVWLDNPGVAPALALAGWDGSLKDVFCQSLNCQADYLSVVEANLGVNKSNYFLDRSYALDFSVRKDSFLHQLTISYKNNSQSGVWPGGDYKNYLRIFAPRETEFSLARLINSETGEQSELPVDEEAEGKNKKSFGALINVPAGSLRQLTLVWETKVSENASELVFLWQKQLGTSVDPLWAHFVFPEETKIGLVEPTPTLISTTSADYNTELTRDLIFNLTWQTKP